MSYAGKITKCLFHASSFSLSLDRPTPSGLILSNLYSLTSRLPIFSFLVFHSPSRRFLHHNFICALLDEAVWSQTCAGPYAHLEPIEEQLANRYETLIMEGQSQSLSFHTMWRLADYENCWYGRERRVTADNLLLGPDVILPERTYRFASCSSIFRI